jgi:hypothetical protein
MDPLRSPHVEIDGSQVRVFCSERCFAERDLPPTEPPVLAAPRRRRLSGLVAAPVCLLFVADTVPGVRVADATQARAFLAWVTALAADLVATPAEPDAAAPGPVEEEPARALWTEELAAERWIHPLAGPKRRMPIRGSRTFGAERDGDRPVECGHGHCGVDIGGEVWGEPVLAAYDGVVDRVQRDPERRPGGLYVRLAHRDATVFTQYFHLAAIPRWIQPGRRVGAGEVIGLLGDTGVKDSFAHLHFAVSVRQSPSDPEQYIDPEPLIALWPVAIPVFGDVGSIASTHVVPGQPHTRTKRGRRRSAAAAPAPPPASSPIEPVAEETAAMP